MKLARLPENWIRNVRGSFFEVLFLAVPEIPCPYQKEALQSMKNQNYRMGVVSG